MTLRTLIARAACFHLIFAAPLALASTPPQPAGGDDASKRAVGDEPSVEPEPDAPAAVEEPAPVLEPAPAPKLPTEVVPVDPPSKTLLGRIDGCDATICMPGRWFFQYGRTSLFDVDTTGRQSDVEHAGRQLIRLHPRVQLPDTLGGRVVIEGEIDLLTGRTFGDLNATALDALYDPDDAHDAWRSPDPGDYRQLSVRWETPFFQLRVGQQTSSWGLGVIANDGQDEDHDVFDNPRFGDLVERALIVTAPFGLLGGNWQKLLLGGGFDVVYRDENALLTNGDLAMQGVISLLWRDLPSAESPKTWGLVTGAYVAIRNQEDDDGDTLEVRAYDLFARFEQRRPADHLRYSVGAEVTLVQGRTNRARNEQARDGLDVLGFGAALQVRLIEERLGLEARFELGYASGDDDRNDGTTHAFSFDPDYHVGMLLFQEVLGRISARGVENARNPALLAVPAKGVEQIATDGAITNAVYLNPVLRWTSTVGLGADLGIVAAWTDAAFSDPWQSAKAGGFNTNYLGKTSNSHFLGLELDAGARYELAIAERVWLRVLLQGALFLPGQAFAGPDGVANIGVVSKLRTAVELGW